MVLDPKFGSNNDECEDICDLCCWKNANKSEIFGAVPTLLLVFGVDVSVVALEARVALSV